MTSPPPLRVRALGPIEQLLGAETPKWKYAQSPELLLYLMMHTAPVRNAAGETELRGGRTRREIERDLPIYSNGTDDNFRARYADLRRQLGSEWFVLENERYKFNSALPYSFDVLEFEQLVRDGKRLANGAHPLEAIPLLQQALALYRGDFMQGHTKRRSPLYDLDDDETEWYETKRQALIGARYECLQHLGELLFQAQQYREAVRLNRLLVAELDDDDDAHYRILYALGAQGLKSDALRHYKQLRERRAPQALDPKLDALAEQIRRGEIAAPAPTASVLHTQQILPPPFQVPADVPRFVGRGAQLEILKTVVRDPSSADSNQLPVAGHQSLCLVGMGGIGKTSLAIHAAYRLREHFPDGVLWGNLRESEPLAILASWERAYGCDFSGLPDLNARAASFRSLLHDKRVLVILDDVTDAADARPLLQNSAHTRTIFTTRSADIAAALDAQIVEMPVLDADESADLLTRILGRPRLEGQENFAREIGALLGHLPLALDITAQRLVSRPHWTLREMADRLRAEMKRLDELQLADRAVRATFALSWDILADAQKIVLAHVGAFEARSFTTDALAYVANVDAPDAREILDALVALSLLSFETVTRYRQHPLLADFSREKLVEFSRRDAAKNQHSEIENRKAYARLSEYFLQFATTHRKNYLALEDEWDNVNAGIEIAYAQELWQAVIDYGDVLTDAWFARGRFTDARRNYPYVMRGARELEEQDPYIAASLHWGKACIDQGDYAEAQEHLQHGLQTSREVSDEYNIANALFLLGRVSVERSDYDAAQTYLVESQAIRERIGNRAGVAETLYMRGRVFSMLGQYTEADALFTGALAVQEQMTLNHSYIVTLRWRGRNADLQRKHELGEQLTRRALEISEQIQDHGEYASALYDIADNLRWQGKNQEALRFSEMSLPLLKQIGDRKAQAFAMEQSSKCAFALHDLEFAQTRALEALQIYQGLREEHGTVRILAHLGEVAYSFRQSERACQFWSEALKVAHKIQHPLTKHIEARVQDFCLTQ